MEEGEGVYFIHTHPKHTFSDNTKKNQDNHKVCYLQSWSQIQKELEEAQIFSMEEEEFGVWLVG